MLHRLILCGEKVFGRKTTGRAVENVGTTQPAVAENADATQTAAAAAAKTTYIVNSQTIEFGECREQLLPHSVVERKCGMPRTYHLGFKRKPGHVYLFKNTPNQR